MERFDDIGRQTDQKASMEMLGRRAVSTAHLLFWCAKKLDGPWGPGRRCGDSSPRLSISMRLRIPAVN